MFTLIGLVLRAPNPERVTDLPEYYASSYMLLHGDGPGVYVPQRLCATQHELFPPMGERCVYMFSPPPGLLWLAPVSLLWKDQAFILWTLLLIAALTTSLVMLVRFGELNHRQSLWLAAGVAVAGPSFESLRIGQLGPILLVVFVGTLLLLRNQRPGWAALLSSILLLKPHYFWPFLLCAFGARKWKLVAYSVLVAILTTGIAWAILGSAGFANFFQLIHNGMTNTQMMNPESSPTLRGQLLRLQLLHLPWLTSNGITMFATIIFCLVLAFCFCMGHTLRQREDWLMVATAVCLPIGLTFSLHVLEYDLVLLYPAVVAWLRLRPLSGLPTPAARLRTTVAIFAVAVYSLPAYVFIHYALVLRGVIINPLFIDMLLITALSMLAWRRNSPAQA